MSYKIDFKGLLFLSAVSLASAIAVSCGNKPFQDQNKVIHAEAGVDSIENVIKNEISSYEWKVYLDHHRMAKAEEAYTPPSIATVFSDSKINSKILQGNDQLIAVDLPFKFLAFAEPDLNGAFLAYTSAEFIQKRHSLPDNLLSEFKLKQDEILRLFPEEIISQTDLEQVGKGFAIIKMKSEFSFEETVNNLKATIKSIDGTKTFGTIDFKKDAHAYDIELNPTTLILFGAPEPGAKAMKNTPKLGLDAFCQKLLIYENQEKEVWVAFNDIAELSKLYYDTSTLPQKMINSRLKKNIKASITK